MALIGTMKYLTIGNQTYEIAGDELQIASASTLGGIKVGNGLSIDSTTGVLSTSITETDPVFAASAAAGITATDISNWNAKVSDTGKWNNVSLAIQQATNSGDGTYVPLFNSLDAASVSLTPVKKTPTANVIAKYDANSYLYSTTPSANDNSTKVATTAYVDAAIPDVSSFITDAGVTKITTTAGTHTAISNSTGAVSFNVPTKTSHLTNDSGFITSFTDVNVTNTAVTAATTYYLTGSTSSSTATGGLSKHAAIKAYVTANSGTGGSARIDLGNTTATTSAGGKEGIVRLYGTTATYYVDIKAGAPSANRTITLPNKTGTVALTSDIPTVPTITLNGTSTTTPSFYAPTTAGTNGYFLKSNGSGAPTWAEIETTAAQIVRW